MTRFSIALTMGLALMVTGACTKKQPEQTAQTQTPPAAQTNPSDLASQPATTTPPGEIEPQAAAPNDLPAQVTLTDGSKYTGTLVSKTGSQLTFRGDNGATRAFDSRDIKSIRFGSPRPDSLPAPTSAAARATPPAESQPAPTTPAPSTPAPVETAKSTPAPPPPPREIVIPSGTQISVRTNEAIDSKTASAGQSFSAVIAQAVRDDSGKTAIPRGASAALVVRSAGAGKIHANDLALDMSSVTVGGRSYEVETADLFQKGKDGVGANKRTAKFAGGGAALGAIIGAIAGGGKGAALGAAAGGGAGAGTQVFTRGSVKVPAETVLTFQLQAPLTLQSH